jgi:hypothetical protein
MMRGRPISIEQARVVRTTHVIGCTAPETPDPRARPAQALQTFQLQFINHSTS